MNEKVIKNIFEEVKNFSYSDNNRTWDSGIINMINNISNHPNNFSKIIFLYFSQIEKTINEILLKPKNFVPDIFQACQNGKITSVQWLIDKENVDKDKKDHFTLNTPIHIASKNGHFHIVEYLISEGANTYTKNENGNYIIHYASRYGYLPIVQYFVEKQNIDIDIKGEYERTPLHYACEYGHLPIVEYLISKGANIELNNENGEYPIHIASKGGHFSIVQYLIEKQNAVKDKKGRWERTPLHYACWKNHLEIFSYLICQGANINAKDEDGNHAIHYAAIGDGLAIIKYLIEYKNIDKDIKGYDEKTPLHYACEKGYDRIANYLISKGANIEAKDKNEDSVIHYASKGGLLSIVQYIIENEHIDKDIKGCDERTPLHYACEEGQYHVVEYLISKGANIEAKDTLYERTSLHFASNSNETEVVKYLVSKGANKNVKDNGDKILFDLTDDEIKHILNIDGFWSSINHFFSCVYILL